MTHAAMLAGREAYELWHTLWGSLGSSQSFYSLSDSTREHWNNYAAEISRRAIAAYQASQSEGEGAETGEALFKRWAKVAWGYDADLAATCYERCTDNELAAWSMLAAPVPPSQSGEIDYKGLVEDIKRRYPKILAALAEDEPPAQPPASQWRGLSPADMPKTATMAGWLDAIRTDVSELNRVMDGREYALLVRDLPSPPDTAQGEG